MITKRLCITVAVYTVSMATVTYWTSNTRILHCFCFDDDHRSICDFKRSLHPHDLAFHSLWNWDLWKSHENHLKIPWTSFHGQWILQNNFSWSHLWPLHFRGKKVKRVSWRMKYNIELDYFHGSWISNETPHYENIPRRFNDGAIWFVSQ